MDEPDYDSMTEEEYMRYMEQKVEYYKLHYPDMYEKAIKWMEMLDHSEVYKTQTGGCAKEETEAYNQALDIIKNMNFNGLTEDDITEKQKDLLTQQIPDWKEKVPKDD
jgi:hypothetical protein